MRLEPTVNINGTAKGELVENLQAYYSALHDARDALAGCAPHGRDYQTVDEVYFIADRAAYRAELKTLNNLMRDVQETAIRINEQGD